MIVNSVTEMTENSLVRINNMRIVDTVTADATGATIRFLSGTDTVYVRFDGSTDLLTAVYTADSFNITGVSRQSDLSSPYDSNYVLWARNMADVQPIMFVGVAQYQQADYSVLLFPNPSNGVFTVQSEVAIQQISIVNSLGQIVEIQNNINQNQLQINSQNLSNGVYLLQIRSNAGVVTRRIQISK